MGSYSSISTESDDAQHDKLIHVIATHWLPGENPTFLAPSVFKRRDITPMQQCTMEYLSGLVASFVGPTRAQPPEQTVDCPADVAASLCWKDHCEFYGRFNNREAAVRGLLMVSEFFTITKMY